MSEATATQTPAPTAQATPAPGQTPPATDPQSPPATPAAPAGSPGTTPAAPPATTPGQATAPAAAASADPAKPGETPPKDSKDPKDPSANESKVPEKYELTLPKDSPLKADRLEKIASLAREQGLSNAQAQQLVERENEAVSDYAKSQMQAFEGLKTQWADQAKADPELGGEHFNQNVELAHRVLKRFGTEQFNKELDSTGFGNHPDLLRVFARIGKSMAEDQLVIPGSKSTGEKRSMEEILYSSNPQAK